MIKILQIIPLAMVAALVACSAPAEENGTLSVTLTDAPFPGDLVAQANVTITKLEVRGSGNGNPFLTLSETTQEYNLLDLRNGVTANLAAVEVPAGSYDLLRLYVSAGQVVMNDGTVYDLTVPSGAQTGIKIFVSPAIEVTGGVTSDLLLDFDVSKSFVALGTANNISGFLFKPVLRAVNSSTVGSVAGGVSDTAAVALNNAEVWAEQDSIISSTFSSSDGSYALLGLLPGSYTVSATLSGYDTVSTIVDVTAGSQTSANFELTP